jgi:hypothetical protein
VGKALGEFQRDLDAVSRGIKGRGYYTYMAPENVPQSANI